MSVKDTSRIVIYNSREMLQIVGPLTDDFRDIIYNGNMFIVQAGGRVFNIRSDCVYDMHLSRNTA